ncbi:unnamed protein product [Calypogeia fissa]
MIPMNMNNSSTKKRELDDDHSHQQPSSDDNERTAIVRTSSSSRRKLDLQHGERQPEGVPLELVDDNYWNEIQTVFDAALQQQSQRQNSPLVSTSASSTPTPSTTTTTATTIPSMVPSILQSSSPPRPPAAASQRFYHDAFCPGHSPESLKQRDFQCQTGVSLKASDRGDSFWRGIGHSSGNGGQVGSPWKSGARPLLPCQFPTRKSSSVGGGGGGTTRIQCGAECPKFQSNEGDSGEERAECDSRPPESEDHNFLAPEMGVGLEKRMEDALGQVSEMALPNAEDGSGDFTTKVSIRRLPAWIEPAGRYLLALEKCRSGSGVEKVMNNSETVEKEQIWRPNAEPLGDVTSVMQNMDNGHPGWVQLEQPPIGLPLGLQPSSCVDVIKPKFPKMQFRGQIVYSKTESEVSAATDELWRRVRELQQTTEGVVPIGFDLEWRANFHKGEIPSKVAVLQLCLDGRRCDVMQIIYSGIPAALQDLLETPTTLKVGVGIFGDAFRLRQDYQIATRKIADLSILANKKMKNPKQWSLAALALELTGKQVDKTRSIRCGNWEALPLSEPQLQYAATDAFASLHLYQVLASFPNLESQQSGNADFKSEPEPPTTQICDSQT